MFGQSLYIQNKFSGYVHILLSPSFLHFFFSRNIIEFLFMFDVFCRGSVESCMNWSTSSEEQKGPGGFCVFRNLKAKSLSFLFSCAKASTSYMLKPFISRSFIFLFHSNFSSLISSAGRLNLRLLQKHLLVKSTDLLRTGFWDCKSALHSIGPNNCLEIPSGI